MKLLTSMRQRIAGFIAPPVPAPVQAARAPAAALGEMGRIIQPGAAARWSILPQLGSITPRYIENILNDAMAGSHAQQWELFDLMQSTWPRLMKNIGELKGGALALDWELEPDHEEGEAPTPEALERVQLVKRCRKQLRARPGHDENGWDATVQDIMDARIVGTTVLEVLDWRLVNGELLPRATAWVHPTNYALAQAGFLGLRGADRRGVVPFPEHKFLVALSKAKAGHPLGGALLRPLAWWWCAANFSADWLLNFAQVFGMPIRWAHYPTGTPQATIDAICAMLQNMGHNAWAAFPEGAQVELKEAGKGSPGSLPQEGILDRADKQCDLLLLGQTLTSDTGGSGQGGGSLALGQVHENIRTQNILAMARFGAEVLNEQLIPSLLTLNYGHADLAPRFCPEPKKAEDKKANAERDAILINAGVQMPAKWFRERHEIPEPQGGEELIGGSAAAPSEVPATRFGKPAAPAEPAAAAPVASRASGKVAEAAQEVQAADAGQACAHCGKPVTHCYPWRTGDRRPLHEECADVVLFGKPVQAAGAPSPADLLRAAFAADLQPARERLERILSISDDALLETKLREFLAEFPQLVKDITADPRSARVLEAQLGTAAANGLATGQDRRPQTADRETKRPA